MRMAFIVASLGRPNEIEFLLSLIGQQSRVPDRIILSVESMNDIPDLPDGVEVIFSERGASCQRNKAIELVIDDCDLMVFLDDDFIPASNFLENAEIFFKSNANVVGMTGLVLADGVSVGGISVSQALKVLEEYNSANSVPYIKDINHVYGCNMVFRSNSVMNIRFDETLPLNSWQEDVDFAARALQGGRVVKTNLVWGVHLGVTRGRTSGVRFGYSQIVNPVYLLRKGTMTPRHAFKIMIKNFVANHLKCIKPEKYIDRRGRVRGNWRAIRDIIKGQGDPRHIIDMH